MKKRKRHWWQNIYWTHLPYVMAYLIIKNIKLITYVLTISFVILQVDKMTLVTEGSANIQEILQAENEAKAAKEIARQKAIQYQKEAESREKERQEEENRLYNKMLNQKHDTEMVSKIYPKGTYLRNKETKEVGQVKEIQGERVITTTFYFDAINCAVNNGIEYLSYKEYKKAIEKELQNKKLTNEEIRQRQEWLIECKKNDTEETMKIWKIGECFTLNNTAYMVDEIDGTDLICHRAGNSKKKKEKIDAYDKSIERITQHEFIRIC